MTDGAGTSELHSPPQHGWLFSSGIWQSCVSMCLLAAPGRWRGWVNDVELARHLGVDSSLTTSPLRLSSPRSGLQPHCWPSLPVLIFRMMRITAASTHLVRRKCLHANTHIEGQGILAHEGAGPWAVTMETQPALGGSGPVPWVPTHWGLTVCQMLVGGTGHSMPPLLPSRSGHSSRHGSRWTGSAYMGFWHCKQT